MAKIKYFNRIILNIIKKKRHPLVMPLKGIRLCFEWHDENKGKHG